MELSKLTAVEIPRFPDPRIGPFLFHGKDEREGVSRNGTPFF